jgi:hypothetical protein
MHSAGRALERQSFFLFSPVQSFPSKQLENAFHAQALPAPSCRKNFNFWGLENQQKVAILCREGQGGLPERRKKGVPGLRS